MSHTQFTYHLVFGTYRRLPMIDANHEKELYKFIYDYSQKRGIVIRRIGGMPDHIHILCDIPANISVAEYVKQIKTESSKFMRVNPHFPVWEGWAEGYGGFTVDAASRETRRQYIMHQREHHHKVSFAEELEKILAEHGMSTEPEV